MEIEFITDDQTIAEYWQPISAREKIPEFIKNLPEVKDSYDSSEKIIDNIKACLPVMDFITAGYLIPVCVECSLTTSVKNYSEVVSLESARTKDLSKPDIKTAKLAAIFDRASCPIDTRDSPKHFFKYTTDWGIKTPPGYSCLIIQPTFFKDKKFTIIPAIVDTDTYHNPIPISGYLNTKEEVRFRPGEYVLQVIPFKRDDWKMSVKVDSPINISKFFIYNVYKRLFHKIKKFV
jgi:hypothetical protein